MSAFDTMIATVFADPNLGVEATFYPHAGPAQTVRILRPPRAYTEFNPYQVGAAAPAFLAEVRVDDLEAEPKEGDRLVVGTDRFLVKKVEHDGDRLVWLLELDKKV